MHSAEHGEWVCLVRLARRLPGSIVHCSDHDGWAWCGWRCVPRPGVWIWPVRANDLWRIVRGASSHGTQAASPAVPAAAGAWPGTTAATWAAAAKDPVRRVRADKPLGTPEPVRGTRSC